MKVLYASAYGTGVLVISSPSSGSLHGLGYCRAASVLRDTMNGTS